MNNTGISKKLKLIIMYGIDVINVCKRLLLLRKSVFINVCYFVENFFKRSLTQLN